MGESPRLRAMVRMFGPLVSRSFFRSRMMNASMSVKATIPDIHHKAVQPRWFPWCDVNERVNDCAILLAWPSVVDSVVGVDCAKHRVANSVMVIARIIIGVSWGMDLRRCCLDVVWVFCVVVIVG